MNVILQALSHVQGLRNFFLDEENYRNIKRPPGDVSFVLVQRFGELIRKLWNPKNFKAHVSPQEMLQVQRKGYMDYVYILPSFNYESVQYIYKRVKVL